MKKITKLFHFVSKMFEIIIFTQFMIKFHFPCSGKHEIKSNNKKNCKNNMNFIFDIFFSYKINKNHTFDR